MRCPTEEEIKGLLSNTSWLGSDLPNKYKAFSLWTIICGVSCWQERCQRELFFPPHYVQTAPLMSSAIEVKTKRKKRKRLFSVSANSLIKMHRVVWPLVLGKISEDAIAGYHNLWSFLGELLNWKIVQNARAFCSTSDWKVEWSFDNHEATTGCSPISFGYSIIKR